MIVYAADGNYVEPETIDVLLISVGSRCEWPFRSALYLHISDGLIRLLS